MVFVAQININLFISDFKISIAVICFPIFLYLIKNISFVSVSIISAFGIYVSRILIYWLQNKTIGTSYLSNLPEIVFYLSFACCIYFYHKFFQKAIPSPAYFMVLIYIDYFSNLLELLLRIKQDAFDPYAQLSITLVAISRACLTYGIILIFDQYRLTLLSREHAERYKRLMVMISKLNGEVLLMNKNSILIEETMNISYQLYNRLKETNPALSADALTVAKDIHEIKKEYHLIMRGLSDALNKEKMESGMSFSDLLTLLENAIKSDAAQNKKNLELITNCETTFYTDKHYLLLSVFYNLFTNALEAATDDRIRITFEVKKAEDFIIFRVSDNGPGIPKDYVDQIFSPGFSTKINYDTGTISRGLGLNIVKDIVEHQLQGSIALVSVPENTAFTIIIPILNLEAA